MSYDDDSGDFETSETVYLDAALDEEEDALSEEDNEVSRLRIKDKNPPIHALEVRRAIEDHIERSRLQKDLDYLFDENFTEDEK